MYNFLVQKSLTFGLLIWRNDVTDIDILKNHSASDSDDLSLKFQCGPFVASKHKPKPANNTNKPSQRGPQAQPKPHHPPQVNLHSKRKLIYAIHSQAM